MEITDISIERDKLVEERKKEKKLREKLQGIKDQSVIMERIVNNLVSDYCDDTDRLVEELNKLLKDIKRGKVKNYSDMGLEVRCLELATGMYKMTEGLAILGSHSDAAKSQRQEAFNRAYTQTKEGTIPDKTAEANNMIIEELLMEKLIDRAYTVITQKVKSANRVLEAIKKVLTSIVVTKEVFRKEANVYDRIDGQQLDDTDDGSIPGDEGSI